MTTHGDAMVRPDGKVKVHLAVEEETYRRLFEWTRTWHMSMGEAIDRLIEQQDA